MPVLRGALGANGFVFLNREGAGRYGVCTFLALEAFAVPLRVQRNDRILSDGLGAAGATCGKQFLKVVLAVGLPVALVERSAH